VSIRRERGRWWRVVRRASEYDPAMDSVEQTLKDFVEATGKLRRAYKPFDDGKNEDPHQVAVATAASMVFVEEAKARLEVALAVARDRGASRTQCLMVVFTCVIAVMTIVQVGMGWLNYQTVKTAKPVVCAETKN
jgi:hypothetical protein